MTITTGTCCGWNYCAFACHLKVRWLYLWWYSSLAFLLNCLWYLYFWWKLWNSRDKNAPAGYCWLWQVTWVVFGLNYHLYLPFLSIKVRLLRFCHYWSLYWAKLFILSLYKLKVIDKMMFSDNGLLFKSFVFFFFFIKHEITVIHIRWHDQYDFHTLRYVGENMQFEKE